MNAKSVSSPSETQKSTKKQSSVRVLVSFAKEHKAMFIASIIFAALAVGAEIAPYYFLTTIIAALLEGTGTWEFYVTQSLYIAFAWLARYVFHSISTTLSHSATFKVLGLMRLALTRKLAAAPLGVVLARPSGAYKNIIVERIDSIEPTLAHVVPELSSRMLAPIVVFIYMLTIDWRVALLSLLTIPLGMVFFARITMNNEEIQREAVDKTKRLNSVAVEYIGGIDVIKIFGKAQSSYEKFVNAAREGAEVYIRWMRNYNTDFSAAMAIMPSVGLSVLPVTSLFMAYGSLTPTEAIMLIVMSMAVVSPLIEAAGRMDDVTKMNVIVREVADVLDIEELQRPSVGALDDETDRIQGCDIAFNSVSFSYEEEKVALRDVTMRFATGSVNALVGPSGSGKSTIARLIASFWDVDSGSITFGGVDIRKLPLETYTSNIAYVSQDNYLFNETILENIKMGRPGASDEEAIEAARAIGCHNFIMSLEDGYNTRVGSAGERLSGGQRQRICIARAMVKDAPIIILDEATAYADPENEALVQESIARLARGKTLIVIAHRLSTIASADVIHLVDSGRISSSGTHEELLETSELYRKMWEAHIASDVIPVGSAKGRG